MNIRVSLSVSALLFVGCPAAEQRGGGGQDTAQVEDIGVIADTGGAPDTGAAPGCTDMCGDESLTECAGGGTRMCADLNDDGCLEWTAPTACPAGTACQDGSCVAACPDADCTVLGAKRCDDQGGVSECADADADGCLAWGPGVPCDAPLLCSNGFCAISCSDTCTVKGAKKCEGNSIVQCDDHDANGCLEWGAAQPCGQQACVGGYCEQQCADQCTADGAKQCDGNGVTVCGDADGDGCLGWGTVSPCPAAETCSNGQCQVGCEDECTVAGAAKCSGDAVITCGDYNNDGCLQWSSPVACPQDQSCGNGVCSAVCVSECSVLGAKKCDEAGNTLHCVDPGGDGCLKWGSPVVCSEGTFCSQGSCLVTCSDDCPQMGATQCAGGAADQFQVCDNFDPDDCLEWGSAQPCAANLVCDGGECVSQCSDECPSGGTVECSGNGHHTCGEYDGDGCLEWGTLTYCGPTQECAAGACSDKAAPVTLLISEILVNSTSTPDKDAFLEIFGPAGTDLTGWTVVGVNGAGGGDYRTIALDGHSIGASGLFLIAHPEAASSGDADLLTKAVDLQNGPDSVQLRYGTLVVDALAYGKFGANHVAAGEGAPVAAAPVNQSLARDGDETDTDNNAADFHVAETPTPGGANVVVAPSNEAPSAALVCPVAISVGESATLDGGGSSDPDGTVALYAFDFGDGQSDQGGLASVTHAWAAPGSYTVTLTVTDDDGAVGTDTCAITVTAGGAPDMTISADTELCGEVLVGALLIQGGATVTCPTGTLAVHADTILLDPASAIDLSATSTESSGGDGKTCTRACVCSPGYSGGGGGGNGAVGTQAPTTQGTARSPEMGGCLGSCVGFNCSGGHAGPARGSDTDLSAPLGGAGGRGCASAYQSCTVTSGRGGGSIRLVATTSIVIQGALRADGEDGQDASGGSGGGAGGSVLLMAPALTVTGEISVAGGAGGSGGLPSVWSPSPADGADGAAGRVKLLYGTSLTQSGSVTGADPVMSIMPPLTIGSTTHPNPTLVYNDTAETVEVHWAAPFGGATGYWYSLATSPDGALTPSNGTFTAGTDVSFAASELGSGGARFFRIVAVDDAAAAGTMARSFPIRINATPHTISSSSHPDSTQWYPGTAIALSFAPPAGAPPESFTKFWYRLDRTSDTAPTTAKSTWTATPNAQVVLTTDWTGAPITDFAYHVHVVAEDTTGHLTQAAAHFTVLVGEAPATLNYFGYVKAADGAPLAGAEVTLQPFGHTTTTDPNGYFLFSDIYQGSYTLHARRDGYQELATSVSVAADAVPAQITLQPTP